MTAEMINFQEFNQREWDKDPAEYVAQGLTVASMTMIAVDMFNWHYREHDGDPRLALVDVDEDGRVQWIEHTVDEWIELAEEALRHMEAKSTLQALIALAGE